MRVIQVRRPLEKPGEATQQDEIWNILRSDDELSALYNTLSIVDLFQGVPWPNILEPATITHFFQQILHCDPQCQTQDLDTFLMISSVDDQEVYTLNPRTLQHFQDPWYREILRTCTTHAMNILLSKAWDRPLRELIDRACVFPDGFPAKRRIFIELANRDRQQEIVQEVPFLQEAKAALQRAVKAIYEPVTSRSVSLLMIRRFLSGLNFFLTDEYNAEGSGSSKPDFLRDISLPLDQRHPFVAMSHIAINISYAGLIQEKLSLEDRHCVEAVVEVVLAHELVHLFVAYLYGDKRTPDEFPFIEHAGDPHSSYYCEKVGNRAFIGLRRDFRMDRRLAIAAHSPDWKLNFAVRDEWLDRYCESRDDPELLTPDVMDLKRMWLKLPVSDDDWIVQDNESRQCLRSSRRRRRSQNPLRPKRMPSLF